MKRKFLILPALCLSLVFSCGDGDRRTAQSEGYQETEGLNESNESENDRNFNVDTDERTSAEGIDDATIEFVSEAASSSMMEVELAKMAEEKAQMQAVKDYAQIIENDHQQANQELKNIAQQENISLPDNLNKNFEEKKQKLEDLSGTEFDKEYISMMVDLHEEDIQRFEANQDNVQNIELKSWIDNTLNTLRQHKEQAEQIKEQL